MKWAATMALAAAAVGLASAACPFGYIEFTVDPSTPVCLRFIQAKATWQGMREICLALGSDLAKVEGDVHQQLVEYINNQTPGTFDDEGFWIGGTDQYDEGYWTWISDGSAIPLKAPHWYPCRSQPDSGTHQNYLCMYTPDFYFHSCFNDYELWGICGY